VVHLARHPQRPDRGHQRGGDRRQPDERPGERQQQPPEARRAVRDRAADRLHAIAAALYGHESRRRAGGPLPPSIPSGWRNNRWRPQELSYRIGGELIEAGSIIVRQRGTRVHPGVNVGVGRDHTLFAKITGKVEFAVKGPDKKNTVNVLPA